ncbi:MAG: sulfur oxidation c-type cytochrome SoxX [Gammaproteobacteria bacterium]|nr:sulfur oxidation c-type cytochrome SoxX [Gammaproteobacteria bacterium]
MIHQAKSLAKSVVGKKSTILLAATLGLGGLFFSTTASAAGLGVQQTSAERGQEIAFTRKLGNCLACHHINGGVSGGTIAPPLVGMKLRFPDRAQLRAQIYDPRVKNPDTSMLPFGAHSILTPAQLEDLVEFLYTL